MKNIKSMKTFEAMSQSDDIDRLEEILDEMNAIMNEADDIVRSTANESGDMIIYERWKAYPYNNIMSMLSSGSKYDTTFSDIIKELKYAMFPGEGKDWD